MAILIPDEEDFSEKKATRDKYMLHNDKNANPQENIAILKGLH